MVGCCQWLIVAFFKYYVVVVLLFMIMLPLLLPSTTSSLLNVFHFANEVTITTHCAVALMLLLLPLLCHQLIVAVDNLNLVVVTKILAVMAVAVTSHCACAVTVMLTITNVAPPHFLVLVSMA